VIDRTSFIAAPRDRLLEFERVHLVERLTRRYGDTRDHRRPHGDVRLV
jgi:hypothetical protein